MPEENATAPDSTETPTPQPDTPQGNSENGGQSATFTQADVDRIVGERAKRAEQSAINKLLESLGVDSVDAAKSVIESEQKRKEAEMTELEKMQLRIDALEKQKAESEAKVKEVEAQRLSDLRDNGLLQLLEKAYDKDAALILIKAKHPDRITSLLNEDGTFNRKEAEKLIEDFQKNNMVLFQSGAPGSPSNKDGRTPQPDVKAAEQAIKQKFGRF